MSTVKDVGEPGAGEPHARFDEAAGGNWHQSGSHTPHGAGASRRPYLDFALLLARERKSGRPERPNTSQLVSRLGSI
jgi:hypothetical protein